MPSANNNRVESFLKSLHAILDPDGGIGEGQDHGNNEPSKEGAHSRPRRESMPSLHDSTPTLLDESSPSLFDSSFDDLEMIPRRSDARRKSLKKGVAPYKPLKSREVFTATFEKLMKQSATVTTQVASRRKSHRQIALAAEFDNDFKPQHRERQLPESILKPIGMALVSSLSHSRTMDGPLHAYEVAIPKKRHSGEKKKAHVSPQKAKKVAKIACVRDNIPGTSNTLKKYSKNDPPPPPPRPPRIHSSTKNIPPFKTHSVSFSPDVYTDTQDVSSSDSDTDVKETKLFDKIPHKTNSTPLPPFRIEDSFFSKNQTKMSDGAKMTLKALGKPIPPPPPRRRHSASESVCSESPHLNHIGLDAFSNRDQAATPRAPRRHSDKKAPSQHVNGRDPDSIPTKNNDDVSKAATKKDTPPKAQQRDQEEENVGFRRDYRLGQSARSPLHIIEEPTKENALQSISKLETHSFVFVKRSDGKWTYAVLAFRSLESFSKNSTTEDEDGKGVVEECMTFVMSDSGASKVIRKKHWAEFVRCVSMEGAPPRKSASGDGAATRGEILVHDLKVEMKQANAQGTSSISKKKKSLVPKKVSVPSNFRDDFSVISNVSVVKPSV
mmetsp:Transcript_19122/g.39731  ORF Transcript_19122/g.39731 Transcript_19122/m.39731 type:complete len:609 (-) Transcript_19122:347-2173(-)